MTTIAVDGKTCIALQKILFATDFSSFSEMALRYALAIARRYDSQMYVAHVIRPDAYPLVPPEALSLSVEQARRYAEQEIAHLLISGCLRGIPHQVLLEQGEIWTTLARMIQAHAIDLVVVGTHGRTGVRKLLLGSVAEEIFRLAGCPVLTVGPKVSGEVRSEAELQRILYATDFTSASERAAAYAASLAQEHRAHLTLLHVVQNAAAASRSDTQLMLEYFTRRLRKLLPQEAELWCEPEFSIEFAPSGGNWADSPAEAILKVAKERRADLLVLGVRRSGNFPGHLPPATAYKVACQSRCPVLTVRG